MKYLLFALFALATNPAFAINKCVGGDGKTVFQDTPCAGVGTKIDVRPASGAAPVRTPNPDGSPPRSEADRLNALTAESQRDRRRWDLRDRLIREASFQLNALRTQCKADIERLRNDQYTYRQNLYGKTHAAQVASEMASVSAQCDTKDRELTGNLQALEKECADIDCRRQ